MNLIEIVISGKNLAKAPMEEARAQSRELGASMGLMGVAAGAALVGIGVESVKMATTYESVTTRLVTSAGEQNKNLKMVQQGMLDMAGQVGVSATDLAKAMYYVESAGFHGADGLNVLKAAAQGAAAEGADTTTVVKAMTDVLIDYHMKASDAADVTSKMITAVSYGKTSLQDFSGAFASIVPAASAAGISFNDVAAALAEMTNHGFTANRASQNLAQALRSLLNPTGPMTKAFDRFGVSTDELKAKLNGPNGLTDAMEYLSQKAEKAGKEGTPAFAAALKLLMGTAPGANAALATVGENFDATSKAIAGIGGASADADGKVKGFAEIQQTLKQQLAQVRAEADALGIRLGTFLIPQLSKLLTLGTGAFGGIASGFSGAATKPVAHDNLHNALLNQDAARPPDLTGWQKFGQELHGIVGDVEEVGKRLEPVGMDFLHFGQDAYQALLKLGVAVEPTVKLLGEGLFGAVELVGKTLANVAGPAIKDFAGFLEAHQGMIKFFAEVILGGMVAKMTILGGIKAAQGVVGLATSILQFPLKQAGDITAAFDGLKAAWAGKEAAQGEQAVQGLAGAFGDLKTKASGALDKILPDSGKLAGLAQMSDKFKGIETAVQDADTQLPRFAVNAQGVATDLDTVATRSTTGGGSILGMAGSFAKAAIPMAAIIGGAGLLGNYLGHLSGVGRSAITDMDGFTRSLSQAASGSGDAQAQINRLVQAINAAPFHIGAASMGDVDKALTQLVTSGHLADAKTEFDQITHALQEQGMSAQDAASKFPGYQKAVQDAGAAAQSADGQVQGLLGTLSQQQQLDQFQTDLGNITQALGQNGKSLSDNSAAAILNRQAFSQAAGDIENYYQQQRNAGVPIRAASDAMQKQVDALEKTGIQAGFTKGDVDKYLRTLGLIPSSIGTTITADIGPAMSSVNGLIERIDSMTGTVQITGSTGGRALGGMAAGGVVGSAAWGGPQGGWTRINEQGEELVHLPMGATVMPHSNTMATLMAGGGGRSGGQPIQVNLNLDGKKVASLLIDPLRGEIRGRGGAGTDSVQRVLGQTF